MFKITAIKAFNDNYIWAIHDNRQALLVDPGTAPPALEFLTTQELDLCGILITHRHHDHIGGIEKLREVYNVPVYGRRHPLNPRITHTLQEGDILEFADFNLTFDIIEIPGHLDDHIAYLAPNLAFCGDVLFGAGCGKNFEGSTGQLQHSLQRLAQLPDTTQMYCAHEYTAANLRFALACEPHNIAIQQRIVATQQALAQNHPTVPFSIALERETNPFLRCRAPELIRTLLQRGLTDATELGVFTALRTWRDRF